jgi:hypothetical protein
VMHFENTAVLRWRLMKGNWELRENKNEFVLKSDSLKLKIHINCSTKITGCTLEKGLESLYYMQSNTLPVLMIKVEKQCIITTNVYF